MKSSKPLRQTAENCVAAAFAFSFIFNALWGILFFDIIRKKISFTQQSNTSTGFKDNVALEAVTRNGRLLVNRFILAAAELRHPWSKLAIPWSTITSSVFLQTGMVKLGIEIGFSDDLNNLIVLRKVASATTEKDIDLFIRRLFHKFALENQEVLSKLQDPYDTDQAERYEKMLRAFFSQFLDGTGWTMTPIFTSQVVAQS
ncbi:MAG: hypothetical protein WC797_01150 [Candidatus Paceibacterota bacterium]|jgi:hypothetical protein